MKRHSRFITATSLIVGLLCLLHSNAFASGLNFRKKSPLTTKGDIFTFSTVDARLGVGSDGQVLSLDSAEATGIKWATLPSGGAPTDATYITQTANASLSNEQSLTAVGAGILSSDASGVLSAVTVQVGSGGTGLTLGTSGGIPYYSASQTIASSAALTDNAVVIGGGAGSTPETITADTATSGHFLASTATSPAFRQIHATDFGSGSNGQVLSFDSSQTGSVAWATLPTSSGETNTASNVGTGNQLFKQKTGVDLEFKTLVSGDNVTMATGVNSITITVASIPSEDVIGTIAIANGGTAATTASGARTNLGLGTISTQDANNVSISGGSVTGITDIVVADGGTGVSTITDGGVLVGKGAGAIENTGLLGKGTLIVGDGATNPTTLTVGSNGTILSADSGEASGLKWVAPATTSAALLAQITDETGTGLLTFATSPTLTTPRFADLGYIADSSGNEQLVFDLATSAVNFVQVSNDATGKYPTIRGDGSDANVGLRLAAKGAGVISTDHAFVQRVVTLTDAATIATDASLGNIFTVTLGGNRTLGTPTNPTDGQKAIWIVSQDATGTRTLAYSNVFSFGTDVTSPTLSTAAGKNDYIGAIYRIKGPTAAKQSWDVVAVSLGYSG